MSNKQKDKKDGPSQSDLLRSTNLNPDDFEIDKEDNHSTHLKYPKKEQ